VQLRTSSPGPTATGATDAPFIAKGQPAPAIVGTTLDGTPFDLASLRGRPVLLNFWGPSCIPCRDEFPLFRAQLAAHATEDLAIVGVLMIDPPAPARDFVAEYGATWPTVVDPDKAFSRAYRVAARPQTYFIDRDGILRSIQVGQLTDAEFERQYALVSGGGSSGGSSGGGAVFTPTFEVPPPP
jgi:cytochrome c biogenesis protein CcmG/thiol:disulfide interchange protein DsbE